MHDSNIAHLDRAPCGVKVCKLTSILRSHFEHNAGPVRSAARGRAIEVACAVQNQAAIRLSSVRAVETPENLLFAVRYLENSSLVVLATGGRGAVREKFPNEHNPRTRIAAIFGAVKAVTELLDPHSSFYFDGPQHVDRSLFLAAAKLRRTVKHFGPNVRDDHGSALGMDAPAKIVDHRRIPAAAAVRRQLECFRCLHGKGFVFD